MIITAGGTVNKIVNKKLYFLIIQKQVEDIIYWEFPKGKLEEGEDLSDCAMREVSEETGVRCYVNNLISKVIGKKKVIYLFDMTMIQMGIFIPTATIKNVRWVTYEDLRKYIKQPLYKNFILKDMKEFYGDKLN